MIDTRPPRVTLTDTAADVTFGTSQRLLLLKVSGAPRPMVRSRPLPGERFDAGLQVRVDRDGSPVIQSDQYRASNTGVSFTHMRPGDWVVSDVDGVA